MAVKMSVMVLWAVNSCLVSGYHHIRGTLVRSSQTSVATYKITWYLNPEDQVMLPVVFHLNAGL